MGALGSSRVPARARLDAGWAALVRFAKAVADADASSIESAARGIGESHSYLAPVAWAAGTIVLLVRGVKLLLLNWRLTLIQLVPAVWIWLTMWDLKAHALRGEPFRHVTTGGMTLVIVFSIALSIAAFWCNTVFAFAIDAPPPPLIRPAMNKTRAHRGRIAVFGTVIGLALGVAAGVVPQLNQSWLYLLCLGGVLSLMLISFVTVPARIIGRTPQKLPPKQAIGRTVTGWALSGVAMAPGFILDRVGLVMLGVPGLRVVGLLVLSLGTALYAAGMSAVKAIKMTIKLAVPPQGDPASAPTNP